MILSLTYFGNPRLRERAVEISEFDDQLAKLASDMIETMHAEQGIGLAGPQVDVGKRIFVMEIPQDMDEDQDGQPLNPQLSGPLVVINPKIETHDEEESEAEEGCLSIPDVRGRVTRPWALSLEYQDLSGASHTLELQGLAARCVLHENDHLDGKLFLDYLSSVKRMAIKGKLKRIKEQYN